MASDLSPGFLVAAPSLSCPFFNHTVVLLVDHGEDGSFGFVVNRPAAVGFGQVLGELGIEVEATPAPDAPVMVGGPVSPEAGWIVYDPHGFTSPPEGSIKVTESVAVSASLDMLHILAAGQGPARRIMMLGYAGWAPGQLDDEIREGAWIPVDLDPALLYETPTDDRWAAALATLGIDPARVVGRTVADA